MEMAVSAAAALRLWRSKRVRPCSCPAPLPPPPPAQRCTGHTAARGPGAWRHASSHARVLVWRAQPWMNECISEHARADAGQLPGACSAAAGWHGGQRRRPAACARPRSGSLRLRLAAPARQPGVCAPHRARAAALDGGAVQPHRRNALRRPKPAGTQRASGLPASQKRVHDAAGHASYAHALHGSTQCRMYSSCWGWWCSGR